ncbi:MAG: prepilin-type N-terminal cleavage/methylation domain-containing protein [Candidatus Omnitrophica bacterium]|nr:prepilin-type N-terminal cleavage/methylation domain-containing protein [Candidatus Omnitrophota bacterium]
MRTTVQEKGDGYKQPSPNFKGVTLMEIIVSLIILSIVIGGLANVIILGKRFVLHSRSRMAGGELGRVFMDPRQMEVRWDDWQKSANCLGSVGAVGCPSGVVNIGGPTSGINYTPTWNITLLDPANPSTSMRRVSVTLTWGER